jgi:hypothetical protein
MGGRPFSKSDITVWVGTWKLLRNYAVLFAKSEVQGLDSPSVFLPVTTTPKKIATLKWHSV